MKRYNSLSFPETLWEEAKILAVRKRISFNELVLQALQHYVDGDHVDSIEVDSEGRISPIEAEKKWLKKGV